MKKKLELRKKSSQNLTMKNERNQRRSKDSKWQTCEEISVCILFGHQRRVAFVPAFVTVSIAPDPFPEVVKVF